MILTQMILTQMSFISFLLFIAHIINMSSEQQSLHPGPEPGPGPGPEPGPEPDLIPPSETFMYKDQVCEIIETLVLHQNPRNNRTRQSILKNRFLSEVLSYEKRRDGTKKYYNIFRFLVTTGSIILPAMMSIGQMDPSKLPANFDNISYWTSFMISLTVTISNGFLQLFSLDKNYFEFSLTTEQLKTEGWQFFQLAGKYEDYPNHEEAYKPFSKSIENIKRKQVEKEFQGKGDVNKNKKDKDKDKDKDLLKTDQKMDLLLGMLGGGSALKQTIGGVRDILDPKSPGPDPDELDIEAGTLPDTEEKVTAKAKAKAKQVVADEIIEPQ